MNAALEFWLFLTLVAVFAISVLSAAAYPFVRRGLGALRPATRADLLLAWALAPPVLGMLIAFSPWVLSAVGLGPAECGRLSDSFLAMCEPDCAIGRALPFVFDALLVAPFVWFGWCATVRLRAARAMTARIDALIAVGNTWDDDGVIFIDSDEPLAFATGWRRCRIVVASCLQRRLSPGELRTVLAHERAHAARRDVVRHLLAELGAAVHVPWVRAMLLADLRSAAEQACDEAAADVVGDRLRVAGTLLRVERLFGVRPAMGFAPVYLLGSDLPARVEALLADRGTANDRWRRMAWALAFLSMAAAVAAAIPLHELTAYFLIYVQG